jgi:hypothetical protein
VAKGRGHDFCLVDGRWLVDFWAWRVFHERDLYDLTNPRDSAIVSILYGDRSTWMDTQETYWNWDGQDVVGEYLGVVTERLGYPIVINNGPPLTERIAHAHRIWENKYGNMNMSA